MTLRIKMPLLIVGIVIVSLVTTGFFIFIGSQGLLLDQSKEEMVSIAERGMETISSLIEASVREVQAYADNKLFARFVNEQAATLEEITSTMEEINQSVALVTENAGQAEEIAQKTLRIVSKNSREY